MPPNIHPTKPAERAIHTWKNHFFASMAGLPKSFPIANWCHLTTLCDATLNMLRPCCKKHYFWPTRRSKAPSLSMLPLWLHLTRKSSST